MEKIKYKKRIVAFIDILGFKELVRKSSNNNEMLSKIYKALSHFVDETKINNDDDKQFCNNLWQYSTQSDCIVISYNFYPKSGSFFNILTSVYLLIIELSYLGFIARGGISIGKLYHNDQNVFGPALVEAVKLEEKVAHYPRVIISNKDYKIGIKEGYLHSSDDEISYINKRLKRDVDGFWYVDFFEQRMEFDRPSNYINYLLNFGTTIKNGLVENENNSDIYAKYCWLANKYNEAIDKQKLDLEKIVY